MTVHATTDQQLGIRKELPAGWIASPVTPDGNVIAEPSSTLQLRRVRLDYRRQALQRRPEVTETLRELRQRGLRFGLVTACSGDVALVWSETPFAGFFDTTVFSCAVGFYKPDPRIYKRAADDFGVSPSTCLYIGDGGHDEQAGATRVGMTAALLQRRNESTRPQVGAWEARIKTIPELLGLVDA